MLNKALPGKKDKMSEVQKGMYLTSATNVVRPIDIPLINIFICRYCR